MVEHVKRASYVVWAATKEWRRGEEVSWWRISLRVPQQGGGLGQEAKGKKDQGRRRANRDTRNLSTLETLESGPANRQPAEPDEQSVATEDPGDEG